MSAGLEERCGGTSKKVLRACVACGKDERFRRDRRQKYYLRKIEYLSDSTFRRGEAQVLYQLHKQQALKTCTPLSPRGLFSIGYQPTHPIQCRHAMHRYAPKQQIVQDPSSLPTTPPPAPKQGSMQIPPPRTFTHRNTQAPSRPLLLGSSSGPSAWSCRP